MATFSESTINERVNSQLYSDVLASYVDINSITAQRNIVPGSYKESVVQCTDQTLATLNSAGGQTLFTRFKLTPAVRNATLAQLAQVYFQYYIPADSLAVAAQIFANNWDTENPGAAPTDIGTNGTQITDTLRFKLFYDSGFSIASMVQLCLTADAKVSTENFNYQQSLLTLNSLPDFVTSNSASETTLKSLVENPSYRGVGSGLIELSMKATQTACYAIPIRKIISIEGIIDLNRGNPLFHNFPIITRNMGELYLRLYMENFLRELKIVYLNKERVPASVSGTIDINLQGKNLVQATPSKTNWNDIDSPTAKLSSSGTDNKFANVGTLALDSLLRADYLPYQRLPADKPDFVYLNGKLCKVRLLNLNNFTPHAGSKEVTTTFNWNAPTQMIYNLDNIHWTRFEIRKVEFDIEEFEDIKASQARAGTYKFPVHIFRSKNFDQTNAASSSANALQTTLNAPNIDRLFITQPFTKEYYTHLPSLAVTDINPQLHNNPVLPRTEDCLNIRTVERLANVYTDTDKYAPSVDLYNSLCVPTANKELYLKSANTYGGLGAFENVQRGLALKFQNVLIPNKFAYGLELNEGGCFRRGFNSVIDGNYSPTVPINLQCSIQTSDDIYYDNNVAHDVILDDGTEQTCKFDTANTGANIVNEPKNGNAAVSYGSFKDSGAVASVHCLCDYIFWINFDQFGNMSDFGCSEFNDRN